MSRFTDAYDKRTGAKSRVPKRWFDNPRLSKNLRKTPLQKAAETRKAAPPATPAPPAGDNQKEK